MKVQPKTLTKETLAVYWRHSKPHRLVITVILALTGVGILADAYVPWTYKHLIDIMSGAVGVASFDAAFRAVVVIAVVVALSQIARRSRDWLNVNYQAAVKVALVNTCFSYVQRHSYGFITDQFVGSLVRKINRYERAFEELADQFTWGLGSTVAQVIASSVGIYILRPSFFFAWLLWLCVYVSFVVYMVRIKRPRDLARAAADTKATGLLADTLTNFHTIKLFASSTREEKSLRAATDDVRKKLLFAWQTNIRLDMGQGFLFTVLQITAVGAAVLLWSQGRFTVGDIALLQIYLTTLNGRLWDLGGQLRRINEALADANEMTEILLLPVEVQDADGAKPLVVTNGAVQFSGVNFAYKTAGNVLKNFSLSIAPGEKVAFVGPSGGGKSTITKLLLRLYNIQKGAISVDGQDIAHVTQDSLRGQISLVPQEPILFHRSLMENIRYGRPGASDAEVIKAAKLAHAHEFISKFTEGYDTLVGERGIKLSGGERQRVAIARAMLKDAPILVMDEATSSLDSESEALIQDALKHLMAKKTVIVIAHRLSTIMQMDRIVVISGGKIIEQGRHEELVKAKEGVYQKLWDIQAGGFAP